MSELDILQEVDATLGSPNKSTDPVAPAGGKPSSGKASSEKKVDPKADEIKSSSTPGQGNPEQEPENVKDVDGNMFKASNKKSKQPGPNQGAQKVKEEIESMFASHDLSEDFKEKATVVFETALNVRINEEVERLNEEFETKLEEQTDVAVSELVEKVDSYLDYVVEKWMEENELAIERGIRTEIAESFMDNLKELLEDHYVDVPEDKVDVLADMAEELEETEKKLDESINELIEARKELMEGKKSDVLDELCEGMTATQREKLEKLVEGVECNDIDEFKSKSEIIKENYFESKTLVESGDDVDPVEGNENVVNLDPVMNEYANAIKRSLKK